MPLPFIAADVAAILRTYRFSFTNEAELQQAIGHTLENDIYVKFMKFKREVKLSERERPDFWSEYFGIAVEVKIKGSQSSVRAQVERYAFLESVKQIILVTTRMNHAIPPFINGKPVERVLLNFQ